MQAMILAAGFGARLLPHTLLRPKPLFPILNRELLLLTITRLQRAGFTRIVVNCHYLSEQIEAAVAGVNGIILQKEENVLGTGGGLRKALGSFDTGPILVTNGDIYHTVDFGLLYRVHCAGDAAVTLAMHDCPRFNTVSCKGARVDHFDARGEEGALAFTGIHVIEPQVLAGIEPEGSSCIIERYRQLLREGGKISCYRADLEKGTNEKFFWTDIGSPQDYLELQGALLTGIAPCWPELAEAAEHPVAPAAEIEPAARLEEWNVIGAAKIGAGARICRSVIWSGVDVAPGAEVCDTFLSGVEEDAALLETAAKLLVDIGRECNMKRVKVLSPDGSNRRFWRLPNFIIVAPAGHAPAEMREAEAVWRIGSHLATRHCAVPQVFGYDAGSGVLVMEDLGSVSLYDRVRELQAAKDFEGVKRLYEKVLARLVLLQVEGGKAFDSSWCCDTPRYDENVMMVQESGYFLRAFWGGLLQRGGPAGIEEEFRALATRAGEAPADYFLHRDCQSRNIMLKEGEPCFIDFQGGRRGPLGYDLASLLMDPYVSLAPQLQDELREYYCTLLSRTAPEACVDRDLFQYHYEDLALQRNLQILGAFAFLSQQKGKPFFARFLKPSVAMLSRRLENSQFAILPLLRKMAAEAAAHFAI
ncbi:MAG: sugar phosphate nucleotidyltransferase [Desulforhopalus sp.]|nr:sugar phosphate nucleotidyltransferase [Desulforhopalus sp.]